MPDICAALESPKGRATGQQYIAWFNQHVASLYGGKLDGAGCYYFRCSMLHQGTTIHPNSRYKRIIFLEPTNGIVFHNNVIMDALNIDVKIFCEEICSAVERWWASVEGTANVQRNLPRFVTRHPQGIAPYIVGTPVIG